MYSRQGTETKLSKISSVLGHEILSRLQTTRINTASLQNLLTLLSGESDSIRSMYCCHRI